MKKPLSLFVVCLSLLAGSYSFAADPESQPVTKCEADAPYKYRIAFSYIGGRHNKHETGAGVTFPCLERKITTQADWVWLQKQIEIDPQVTQVTIMSATQVEE